jgi:hypothetical protein
MLCGNKNSSHCNKNQEIVEIVITKIDNKNKAGEKRKNLLGSK